jgi:type IV pilus assembly protein PilM
MFDILKKLLPNTNTSKLFQGNNGSSVCGIDIGSGSVKVVQLKQEKGRIILETYGALSLSPFAQEPIGKPVLLPEPEMVKAIVQVMQEARITAKRFVVSLPSSSVLVFVVTLPKESARDLNTIIPNEARKYIPVPITEVSLDWFIIPDKETYEQESTTPSTTIDILVVAVRNETLQGNQKILAQAQVPSPLFEIESFATMRSVLRREIAPVLIVDIGTAVTSMIIVEYGVIRIFHTANRGSAFTTESLMRSLSVPFEKAEEIKYNPEKYPESVAIINDSHQYIVSEIKRVLLEYEHTYGRVVSKIIISGGGSIVVGFKELVTKETTLETLSANPFDKTDAPEFMRPLLEKTGPEFSVATGLALKDMLSF